jgi:preprotein translocase subunit SecY
LIEIAVLVAIIMGLIILIQGVRKIPINYAKQIVGNRQFGGARQFLPVKVNSAGGYAYNICTGYNVPSNLVFLY